MAAKNLAKLLLLAGVFFGFGGCTVTTNTITLGQKTALERQLMGELEPLSEEELLAASVRASGDRASFSLSEIEARALSARRRQLFNRDDIDELKDAGCLAEMRNGRIAAHSCSLDSPVVAERERLIEEENADRDAIVAWAIAADPALTAGDRPQVNELLHQLMVSRASGKHWYETPDGTVQPKNGE